MKSLKTIFFPLTFAIIFCLISNTLLFAGDQQVKQSPRERAMNAAQQMRDYHKILETKQLKNSDRSTSSVKTEASIRINQSVKTGSTIHFYDNMESGLNGWTSVSYSGTDLWHQTVSNASSKPTSWWDGIEQQGNYLNGERINNALISPPINLVSAIAPVQLLFTESFVTERGWDYCMVDVSVDGGASWTHLRGGYGTAPSGNTEGWMISNLDLSAYAGSVINLRFYFDTGDNLYNEFPGWYVDDVIIFDQSGMITGKKYFDENQNGLKEYNEHGLKEWLITATSSQISLTTRTNYWGKYWLPVPLGTYTVTEQNQAGWTQTGPPGGQWVIDLATPDTLVDSIRFGNWTEASSISGMMYHDIDQNGSFDGADTVLPFWKIILTDTLGNQVDYDRTDSLGQYKLYILQPGKYFVKEIEKQGWVQKLPSSEYYTVDIPDLNTHLVNLDFSNYWSPTTNGIMGLKFADRNRNHAWDQGEENLSGVLIKLFRKGNGTNYNLHKQRITDSSGYYQFLSLEADTYKVVELPPEGWWQSYPLSEYVIDLTPAGVFDTIDFGNYEIDYSSLGGMKFNDLDGNGAKDQGENGLGSWTIMLSGTSAYGKTVSREALTDQDGNYIFTTLWPGNYRVSEVFKPNWRQTHPANLKPHFVNLDPEFNMTGIDFGNTLDSSFSLAFRTFLPESLANAIDLKGKPKPITQKPIGVSFQYEIWWAGWDLLEDVKDDTVNLRLKFSMPTSGKIDGRRCENGLIGDYPNIATWENMQEVLLRIPAGQYRENLCGPEPTTLTITGIGKVGKPVTMKYIWIEYNGVRSKGILPGAPLTPTYDIIVRMDLLLPMPNAINLLSAGAGTGLKVGLGGAHSVLHPTYKDVLKSLKDKHGMHTGDPGCLGAWSGIKPKPIKKQQKYLPPTKHNNKLFAEGIALQANINGSDYGILPGGFGNLIFDEGGTNPLNGLKISQIAARLDSMMSLYHDTNHVCTYPGTTTFMEMFNTVRKIDSAFSGPIDTFQFAGGLRFKPVKPLSEVPYLHLDSSFIEMGSFVFKPIPEAIPERFELSQNYPNPFNPSTMIEFYLPYESFVTLKIYNSIGQEVATLLDRQDMDFGSQEIELSATAANLASGVYYYRIVAETIGDDETQGGEKYVSTKKMILIK
ncbi:MAG: immune inhibitor A [Ignavibacteriales bacterium]|nr:immune inhibitor A [Ignavibacteriales bacterium]